MNPNIELPPSLDFDPPEVPCISGVKRCEYSGSVYTCDCCGAPTCWCNGGTEEGCEGMCDECWAVRDALLALGGAP